MQAVDPVLRRQHSVGCELRTLTAAIAILALVPSGRAAGQGTGWIVAGEVTSYSVRQGDTLRRIGTRAGVDVTTLADANGIATDAPLRVGQSLVIDNRHIVPAGMETDGLLVNIPQRMLFRAGIDGDLDAWPVAVGRPGWATPTASFTVALKETAPTWNVPASIREESRRVGRTLPETVPPGPDNPLGAYWIGLSIPGVGVHGTNAPQSIYRAATHGCIRAHPDDIAKLFGRVRVGTAGRIVYEPVLLAAAGDAVFLEVHRDVYGRLAGGTRQRARALAAASGLADRIDWTIADAVIEARHGIARDVTKHTPAP